MNNFDKKCIACGKTKSPYDFPLWLENGKMERQAKCKDCFYAKKEPQSSKERDAEMFESLKDLFGI